MVNPCKKDFLEKVMQGSVPPLYRELPFSEPYLYYEALYSGNSFLLESVKGPSRIARYSFIGVAPCIIYRAKNGLSELLFSGGKKIYQSDPLRFLKELIASYRQKAWEHLPPFQGGLGGLLSYDFVHYLEQIPATAIDDTLLPDAHFFVTDKVLAFDHEAKKCWIIACPGVQEMLVSGSSPDWSEQYEKTAEVIEDIYKKISLFTQHPTGKSDTQILIRNELKELPKKQQHRNHSEITYEMSRKKYMDIVRKVKEYIAAGDIFQANLSQRVSARINEKDPWKLYKILRSINPSPFAAFLHFGDYQIVSSSPERLVRVNDGLIETRPIAGTRPRGRDRKEDESMRRELLLNEKERAEHLMLIDLERNDIGRVSDYGSIKVDELMITEDYSHVIHIVSNIKGRLGAGKDCFDVIRATFPGGTITGVPKVRCMEIIDEVEPVRRGPYTGSIGYIGFSGNMDFNIVIRTIVIQKGRAFVQVGAGIVADSDPAREYGETLQKAEALIRTLEMV